MRDPIKPTERSSAEATRVIKKLLPGQPGTHRWSERFGHQLVCVRYREAEDGTRFTTVELVVAERPPLHPHEDPRIPAKAVAVKVSFEETELRQQLKLRGAAWDPLKKVWWADKGVVRELNLTHRILKKA